MKNRLLYKKIVMLCVFLCVVVAYATFLVKHYSVDAFSVYFAKDSNIHIQNARYLAYVIDSLLRIININPIIYQHFFVLILMSALTICICKLVSLISAFGLVQEVKDYIGTTCIISLAFINVFFTEWFIYVEIDIYYALSILLIIIAVCMVVKENKWWIQFGIPFVCVIASLLFYQASMSIFVIWANTFFFIKYYLNRQKKQLIKNIIGVLVIGGSGSVVSVVGSGLTAGAATTRKAVFSFQLIVNNIEELLRSQIAMWDSALGLMPRFIMLMMVVILLLLLGLSVKKNIAGVLALILAINYAIIFAPHLVSSQIWLAPRTVVSWFSWISSLGLIIWLFIKERKCVWVVYSLFAIVIGISMVEIWLIGSDQIKTNQAEEKEAKIVQKIIEDYEEQSGNEVTKIAVTTDRNVTYYHTDVEKRCLDINARCYVVSWGDVNAINYFNNENYERTEFDNVKYLNYFKDKDWDYFIPGEQCIFDGDTLYWCIY